MLSISVIVFFSVVLFAYWFRYSCLLILQNRTSVDQAHAFGSGLTFPAVQQRLKGETKSLDLLDQLHRDLSNDYRILCFLLRCSADTGVDPVPLEERLDEGGPVVGPPRVGVPDVRGEELEEPMSGALAGLGDGRGNHGLVGGECHRRLGLVSDD